MDQILGGRSVDDTDRVFAEIASAADEFHGVVKTMELDARTVIQIERAWCGAPFDDGRPWYRNGFVSPDATSGYAAWVLPGVEAALMKGDADRLRGQLRAIRTWFRVSASIAMGFYPE
jgi:hypothetical protein